MAALDEGTHAGPGKRRQTHAMPEHVDGRFVAHRENPSLKLAFPGCAACQVDPNITWAARGPSTSYAAVTLVAPRSARAFSIAGMSRSYFKTLAMSASDKVSITQVPPIAPGRPGIVELRAKVFADFSPSLPRIRDPSHDEADGAQHLEIIVALEVYGPGSALFCARVPRLAVGIRGIVEAHFENEALGQHEPEAGEIALQ